MTQQNKTPSLGSPTIFLLLFGEPFGEGFETDRNFTRKSGIMLCECAK